MFKLFYIELILFFSLKLVEFKCHNKMFVKKPFSSLYLGFDGLSDRCVPFAFEKTDEMGEGIAFGEDEIWMIEH